MLLLEKLLSAHATPGDETAVADILLAAWRDAGLATRRLGAHAILADTAPRSRKPPLLITAHMDSCGFAVDRVDTLGLVPLGHPDTAKASISVILKTRAGLFRGTLRRKLRADKTPDFWFHPADGERPEAAHGDRVAFAPSFARDGNMISSPFLDNRMGCWLLARLAPLLKKWKLPRRVILGATGSEEMCGFGASVLARETKPAAAVVLDTTYVNPAQNVRLGNGPVLTLSDKSILLSLDLRDRLLAVFRDAGQPLQTEVYNFSGTDARAFPLAGLSGPVVPLLVPTTGNHSPRETADLRDAEILLAMLRHITEHGLSSP
ncbi:MAG: M28 family peptidase [Kiritimatiellaeota bacterium]|nr:M28 family peptidase [Kiritimatiellota bacterium]